MDVYTATPPNGWEITVMIEELKEAGLQPPEVHLRTANVGGKQFAPEFAAIGPNRKIPVAHAISFGIGPERRARMGIADSLIRIPTGIEDVEDLIADLRQELAA